MKSPSDRGKPQFEGPFFAGGIRSVRFDSAFARGPIDFPYPCRYGPGAGASEFAEATITASDPVTGPSVSNSRQAALRRRPRGAHRVRV